MEIALCLQDNIASVIVVLQFHIALSRAVVQAVPDRQYCWQAPSQKTTGLPM